MAWHQEKVDIHARKQYLAAVRNEYARAGEKARRRLLDEAEKRAKYNRKYPTRAWKPDPAR